MTQTKHAIGLEALVMTEKLGACLWPLGQFLDQTREIASEHPELLPEITTAQKAILEATAALERAVTFLQTKYEVAA